MTAEDNRTARRPLLDWIAAALLALGLIFVSTGLLPYPVAERRSSRSATTPSCPAHRLLTGIVLAVCGLAASVSALLLTQ